MTIGLREQKKRQTRQAISDVATVMFVEHGYDAVTISQVAAAAGVSKMTVTNYFPRKEDLVFDRADAIISGLADVVAGRAPGESMLVAVRRDYAEAVARGEVTLGVSTPAFAQMITGSPALADRGLEIAYLRERALGDAIVAETGADSPAQRIIAAQLAAVYRVLTAEGIALTLTGQSREAILTELGVQAERAFDLLEPSLGEYGIR